MKPILVVAACLVLLGSTLSAASTKERTLMTELDFYLVNGDIWDETPPTDDTWPGLPREELPTKRVPESFFSHAELSVANVKLKADEDRWMWDGKGELPKDAGIELLANPKLASIMGERMAVWIGSEKRIQYFEKRPDGLFELRSSDVLDGLQFEATVDEGNSGGTLLCDLKMSVSLVLQRLPLEGVTLDVGPPVVTKRDSTTTINLRRGKYYGMLLPIGEQRTLLVRMRVDIEN